MDRDPLKTPWEQHDSAAHNAAEPVSIAAIEARGKRLQYRYLFDLVVGLAASAVMIWVCLATIHSNLNNGETLKPLAIAVVAFYALGFCLSLWMASTYFTLGRGQQCSGKDSLSVEITQVKRQLLFNVLIEVSFAIATVCLLYWVRSKLVGTIDINTGLFHFCVLVGLGIAVYFHVRLRRRGVQRLADLDTLHREPEVQL